MLVGVYAINLFPVRTTILFVVFSALLTGAYAQNNPKPIVGKPAKNYLLYNRDGQEVYLHEFSGGFRLNTNGWNAFLELGHHKNEQFTNIYQFEVGETKSPKERKSANPVGVDFFGNVYTTHPYVYGKQNIFYQMRLAIGQRYLVGTKANKNGVEVSAVYLGGLSMGILRPYYLQVYVDSSSNATTYIRYTGSNKTQFLDAYNILGGTGLQKGWDQLKWVPGLYARVGMRFDWAAFNSMVSAIEVSASGQYYFQDVAIMVDNKPQKFFFNASVGLIFGKKW
jgi:hypothetical protein